MLIKEKTEKNRQRQTRSVKPTDRMTKIDKNRQRKKQTGKDTKEKQIQNHMNRKKKNRSDPLDIYEYIKQI